MGNVIYRAYENRELQLRSQHHSQYDAVGNKILAERYDMDGQLLSRTKWAYDEMGNITRQDYYNDNTLLSTTLWEYQYAWDAADRLTMKAQYNAKAELDHRYEYTYDDKGNRISETYYSSDGKPQDRCSWEYDHRGNLRRESRTDANGLLYEETIWSRDLRTKTITHYTYRPDSTLEKTETETYTDPIAFYNP
jgi:antitoxin component YwqK of YwqJK toxin-antitoxin module